MCRISEEADGLYTGCTADIFLHSEIPEGQKPDAKLISEIEIKNSGKTDEKKEFLIRQSIRERGTENYRQIGESRVA